MTERGNIEKGKIGALQKFRSYVEDVLIERIPKPPDPTLELFLRSGRLMLTSPRAIYSFEDKYTSFAGAFELAEIAEIKPESVLVLGFGLGSIPLILSRRFKLRPSITGLEIDPRVIRLAHRWLPDKTLNQLELLNLDAISWVGENTATYDLICVDIFVDHEVPEACSETQFLQHVRNCMHKDSLLLFSRLDMEAPPVRKIFIAAFTKIFPTHHKWQIGSNTIFAVYENT